MAAEFAVHLSTVLVYGSTLAPYWSKSITVDDVDDTLLVSSDIGALYTVWNGDESYREHVQAPVGITISDQIGWINPVQPVPEEPNAGAIVRLVLCVACLVLSTLFSILLFMGRHRMARRTGVMTAATLGITWILYTILVFTDDGFSEEAKNCKGELDTSTGITCEKTVLGGFEVREVETVGGQSYKFRTRVEYFYFGYLGMVAASLLSSLGVYLSFQEEKEDNATKSGETTSYLGHAVKAAAQAQAELDMELATQGSHFTTSSYDTNKVADDFDEEPAEPFRYPDQDGNPEF